MPNAKARRHPEQGERTIWDVFEEERASFIPYAGRFDGYHCIPASVSKTCTVRFDNNKYSVLSSAVGRPVEIHAYADRIVIRQDGAVIGEHARSFGRNEVVYDPTCRCWPANRTACTARLSGNGFCHQPWRRCAGSRLRARMLRITAAEQTPCSSASWQAALDRAQSVSQDAGEDRHHLPVAVIGRP